MTEKLKTLLDDAAEGAGMSFATPDLDAITKAGDRTVRRRRVATGLAGMAAVAAIVTGVAVVSGGPSNDRVDPAGTFSTEVPMWTVGSTLHTPDATYDVGHEVAAFVRTSAGIVFASPEKDGFFSIWAYDGGEAKKIGNTDNNIDQSMLKSDPGAPYAAWIEVDPAGEGEWTNVVYDQASGERVFGAGVGANRPEHKWQMMALDGDRLAVADPVRPHGVSVIDLATGEASSPEDMQGEYVLALDGDRWVGLREIGREDAGITLHTPSGNADLPDVEGGMVSFSPNGTYFLAVKEGIGVFDAGNATAVSVGGDEAGAVGLEWVDADTILALRGLDSDGPAEILSCEVPDGNCTKLGDLPQVGDDEIAALGIGWPIWASLEMREGDAESSEGGGSASSESMALPSDYATAEHLIESMSAQMEASEFVAADGSIFCDIDGMYDDVPMGAACQLGGEGIDDPMCAPETDGLNVVQFLDGVPEPGCATDTIWQGGAIEIAEPHAVQSGTIRCAVEIGPDASAVTCIDTDLGRGFALTPEGYAVF